MSQKIIVSDFDGTLIGTEQKITSKSASAITEFVKRGNIFSIATGRAYEGLLEDVCHQLGLDGLHIVRGGSEIVSSMTGEVVWGKYLKASLVPKIIDFLSRHKEVTILAESGKNLYTLDGVGNKEFATGASIKKISDLPHDKTPKIAIPPLFEEKCIIPIYEALLEQYPTLHIIKTTSKKGMGIDINDGSAGKHSALLEYARLIDQDPKNITGVGDSYNDYPLLSACGTKVAMGNAPEELKEVADLIVPTQEHDGIIEVIRYVLEC